MMPSLLVQGQFEARIQLRPSVVIRRIPAVQAPTADALKVAIHADGRDYHKRVALAADASSCTVVDGGDGADGGEARAACSSSAVVSDGAAAAGGDGSGGSVGGRSLATRGSGVDR